MSTPRLVDCEVRNVSFGDRVTVMNPSNLYLCSIDDDCFIGPFVEIQRGAKLGKRCRIQSHTFICEKVEIGDDCFISHGVTFTNDLFRGGHPERNEPGRFLSTKLGKNVSVGSGVTLLPVTICDFVVIGAGSVVTKDISNPGIYAGNPARFLRCL